MAFQSALIWPCIVARRGLFACGLGKRLNASTRFANSAEFKWHTYRTDATTIMTICVGASHAAPSQRHPRRNSLASCSQARPGLTNGPSRSIGAIAAALTVLGNFPQYQIRSAYVGLRRWCKSSFSAFSPASLAACGVAKTSPLYSTPSGFDLRRISHVQRVREGGRPPRRFTITK